MGTEHLSALPGSGEGVESPIINSPFEEPILHWRLDREQEPARFVKFDARRSACYYYRVPEHAGRGLVRRPQTEVFRDQKGEEIELALVNAIRKRLKLWRSGSLTVRKPYDGVSDVTRELLEHWHSQERKERLFFAQLEAVETVIFLMEASPDYRKGLQEIPKDKPGPAAKAKGSRALIRYACKMATGSGKTTVMGMLAAWSILNRLRYPADNRYSDTILIVCPNITIRERLAELDPARGDLSLYRTRQLVPAERMEEMRKGEVIIVNWHLLEKKKSNQVNGEAANVVKTGEQVIRVKNPGKKNERVVIEYYESDAAWFKRFRQRHGNGKGKSKKWMVFNDEAHHAYRRGDASKAENLDEDGFLARKNAREATVWIEGLDRIDRLVGGKRPRGLALCVDLSATPFYIQGSGNEIGKPFPWIVSDFGLLDAIESGLVKIPQLPSRDSSGGEQPSYFNIWRWVQERADQDGFGKDITPELVMNYASAPINMMAADWHKCFEQWKRVAVKRQSHPIPPAFIVVCRDTSVAREVHGWLANGNDRYGASPTWLRNSPGNEVTVRVDSRVVEDIEKGGSQQETRRLRYILDTLGRSEWPGGKVPNEWSQYVVKNNKLVAQGSHSSELEWIDENIPPGRDVRCIVSVAMLIEGWDANTVTHIVGLRPFGSQLLCEQVLGRALRRKSYALNEETRKFVEETALVMGVPFELIPFKVSPADAPQERDLTHIFAVGEKAKYEITFPVVSGYHDDQDIEMRVDWSQVSQVTIDPQKIPSMVELTALTDPAGAFQVVRPGKPIWLNLQEWREKYRDQQVAFLLALEVCKLWSKDRAAPAHVMQRLFPKVVLTARRFLSEKLVLRGDSCPCDIVLVGEYMQKAIASIFDAIRTGVSTASAEVAVVPQGSEGRKSTRHVDFYTAKRTVRAEKCHLNEMVADTAVWEQTTAFGLDQRSDIIKWVKNYKLRFYIPYRRRSLPARYEPDFIVVKSDGENVIVEVKGQVTDNADAKAKAAERWVAAVNRLRVHGKWRYVMVTDPGNLSEV